MTNREFYTAIASIDTISAELRDFAQSAIEKLDARNAHRSARPSKVAVANAPLKDAIVEWLGGREPTVASEIGAGLEMTTQKVSALCRQLVADDRLTVTEVKIPKKGVQKAYSING